MLVIVTQFATAAHGGGEQQNLFSSLGIDWRLLILQTIAFLILLVILSKFVFPVLTKMIDDREAKISEGQRAAEAAVQQAAAAQGETKELLKQARADAAEIVADAKTEAAELVSRSEAQARDRADTIVRDAQAQISKELGAARAALANETRNLVAAATEKVVSEKFTKSLDDEAISHAIKEVK